MSDSMENLRNFKLRDLYATLALPDDEFQQLLKTWGLLASYQRCECGADMRFSPFVNRVSRWTCTRKKDCGKTKSVLDGSFFEDTRISQKVVFHMSYFWSQKIAKFKFLKFHVRENLSDETIVQWLQYYREFCAEWFLQYPMIIGGPNIIVDKNLK